MKIRKNYTCPLEIIHDIIKGKWKPIIIFKLKNNSKSLSELKKSIAGISQKMLLEQLKELQKFKIVDKSSSKGYPLHVEYFLTKNKGTRLLQAFEIMQDIGIDYMLENGKKKELIEKGFTNDILDQIYNKS
ncbi:winged helix-turn-helix transcriptional regulator [Pectinatus frisingensis]|jgi:DNA-binding HxlR family transcriptional regulator|uniref:winged helix-turn-helix transcriptional regulator n=1 Tax=Pectinatus frisingensis TaxID=865 RepID=UPI0018C78412|nr:helix-turn-helix domain-containing protein [Pectinatus frisingensis]